MQVYLLPTSAHTCAFHGVVEELLSQNDESTLAQIFATIKHVAANGGHPQEPTSRRLRGIDMCEIKSKYHHQELIRIYYFADKEAQKLLLLNYIIKPDGSNRQSSYQGNAGKKLDRKIEESIQLAVVLKTQYPSHHSAYELLPL